ncbi:MAG TPA: hypothetical protein VLJ68_00270, partial [Chitinophagaceae bacterium]|nr:hypothetical protein [Chitinophagaceae bacterium]
MKYKNIIATISFIFLQIDLWSQSEISLAKVMYSVDKQLEFKQSKFEFIDSGVLKKSMKIKVLWNNNVFFNNYEDKDALDCFTFSTIKNDSIFIVGYMTGMFGYGFELTIINDSCIAAPFAVSDEKIYKYIPTA